MNLSSNKFPRGLVTLEGIFNLDDQSKNKASNLTVGKDDYVPMIFVEGNALNLGKLCSKTNQEILFFSLYLEFNDIFAWTYEDLKGFDPSFFQHTIDLNENTKPVRQKQRSVNPRIEPLMRKDLTKLIEVNIIFPVKL